MISLPLKHLENWLQLDYRGAIQTLKINGLVCPWAFSMSFGQPSPWEPSPLQHSPSWQEHGKMDGFWRLRYWALASSDRDKTHQCWNGYLRDSSRPGCGRSQPSWMPVLEDFDEECPICHEKGSDMLSRGHELVMHVLCWAEPRRRFRICSYAFPYPVWTVRRGIWNCVMN